MRLIDLIEALQDQLAELSGPEQQVAEVRLMTQENWPFENGIAGVVAAADIADEDDEDDDHYEPVENDSCAPMVYICEGRQIGYGTKAAWSQL